METCKVCGSQVYVEEEAKYFEHCNVKFLVTRGPIIRRRCNICGRILEKTDENDLYLHVACPKCGEPQFFRKYA